MYKSQKGSFSVGKIAEKAVYKECIFDNVALYFGCWIELNWVRQWGKLIGEFLTNQMTEFNEINNNNVIKTR